MSLLFVSHVSTDEHVVVEISRELEAANYSSWYYERDGLVGTSYLTVTGQIIDESDAFIVLISSSSIKSPTQVTKEIVRASESKKPIIPLLLGITHEDFRQGQPEWREALGATVSLVVDENNIPDSVDQIIAGLKKLGIHPGKKLQDIYVSCSWREYEALLPQKVCRSLISSGFRLVGDSRDQIGFGEGDRIRSIMSSCGGFVAIVPNRGGGQTSKPILREIEIANTLSLPGFIITEPGVIINDSQGLPVISMEKEDKPSENSLFLGLLYDLKEGWCEPVNPHYVFFATDLDKQNRSRNLQFKKIVQKITAMECILGEDIREKLIQEFITKQIRNAFVMIADLSKNESSELLAFNLNTCIEAGIARGAQMENLFLVCREPVRSPPFMFYDKQVFFYKDEKHFFKQMENILLPFRRRIINLEL